MRFSEAVRPWLQPALNPLTIALREAGPDVVDLVGGGPALEFPNDDLARIMSEAARAARVYRPDPLGQAKARRAIADWYAARDWTLHPEHVVLTPGTSVGYLYLLRLLLDPGDDLLVPHPGYPLFDELCQIAGVGKRYYHLDNRHRPDFEDLDFQCTARTRAIVVVSPHNPLGAVFSTEDWKALAAICQRHSLALICDEVFSEFLTDPRRVLPRPHAAAFPLVFVLNGLSKMLALPGMKAAWIAAAGQRELVQRAVSGLSFISDAFLPVNELVQAALPQLLATDVSGRLAEAYRARRAVVQAELAIVPAEGGVYVCVPLPTGADEDALCMQALQEARVHVHPGHYYNLPGHIVFTCVASEDILREGARRLNAVVRQIQTV